MDIYEALKKIIIVKPRSLQSSLFLDDVRKELDSDNDIIIWDLLKNISSVKIKTTIDSASIHPKMVFEGKRTFSVEDLSKDDFEILNELTFDKIPLNLRAKIADILWIYQKKYPMAKIAAKSYYELFVFWFSEEKWEGTLDMIKRAICISTQINDNEIFEKSCDYIFNKLIIIDGKDDDFLSLRLLDILFFHKDKDFKDLQIYIYIAKNIIDYHYEDVSKVEQASSIIRKCYIKLNKQNEAKNTNIYLANYYVEHADKIIDMNIQEVMRHKHYLQQAVLLYRNNGSVDKAKETHRKLISVQKKIPKMIVPISTEIDVSELHKIIDLNFKDLSIEESIIRLTQMITLYKKDEMKNKVIEEYKNYSFSHLFKENIIDASGQTIFTLLPLDITNIEANEELLNLHINQKILKDGEIAGDICIKYALYRIRQNYNVKREDIEFLIKNNPIIPEGRKRIFCSAIYMILCGQYYEGIHILAPQVENLFICIAKEVGGLTVTLESDGSSKEKVLSSIFDLPELVDCYDNDILYLFKALLNEQSGANIRNEIAHGIVNEDRASSGVYLYFAIAVMKLLSFTSPECYIVLKKSKNLKNFIKPSNDDLKIK